MSIANRFLEQFMEGYKIRGWIYDGDIHCEGCAYDRFGVRIYDEENPPEDSEGNPITPLFASDAIGDEVCGDCGSPL